MEGVGSAIAREKERNENSIDLYLTDLDGQPVTEEFAETVKSWMWEERRIVGHDLEVHPAPVFIVVVAAHLITVEGSDLNEMAASIQERVMTYASDRKKLAYNYVGSLLLISGVEDYENYTLNGMEEDVEMTPSSIPHVEVVLS
ncbi:Baseplate J-like protein [compost metagenome]